MNTGSRRGPTLRRHKRSGRSYAKFHGRQVWFGPFDDQQTHVAFAAFKMRWEANGREWVDGGEGEGPYRVSDPFADYLEYLEAKHDAGWLERILPRTRYALKPALELFGPELAADFSPRRLEAVKNEMIRRAKLCRSEINSRVFARDGRSLRSLWRPCGRRCPT